MKYHRIAKQCPFCPTIKSAYTFKTFHGLRKHILQWHLQTKKRRSWYIWSRGRGRFPNKEKPAFIRVYKVKYSEYRDIPVNGMAHVEAIVQDHCKEFNPSMRGIKVWPMN